MAERSESHVQFRAAGACSRVDNAAYRGTFAASFRAARRVWTSATARRMRETADPQLEKARSTSPGSKVAAVPPGAAGFIFGSGQAIEQMFLSGPPTPSGEPPLVSPSNGARTQAEESRVAGGGESARFIWEICNLLRGPY